MTREAEGMAALRQRRADAGLVRVEVHIRPQEKQRLARYVRQRLGGECSVRPTRSGTCSGDEQGELSV